jgi:nucleolar pre-ribosomal-associated protein 2
VDLDTVGGVPKETNKKKKGAVYHGREEWLLRWLLKRFQAPKDDVPRYVLWHDFEGKD